MVRFAFCAAMSRRLLLLAALSAALWSLSGFAQAQEPPPEVRQLRELLESPVVRNWLRDAQRTPAPPAAPGGDMSDMAEGHIAAIRRHLQHMLAAAPRVPGEARAAGMRVADEMRTHGSGSILALVLFFAALGFGAEQAFRVLTRKMRTRIAGMPLDFPGQRARAAGARFVDSALLLTAFTAGSIGAFLLFEWPPLLRRIALSLLVAALILRSALVLGRALFATDVHENDVQARFRLVKMPRENAAFWQRRIAVIVGLLAFGAAIFGVLPALGVSEAVRDILTDAATLVLLAVALEIVWNRPAPAPTGPSPSAFGATGRIGRWFMTAYVVAAWVVWVVGQNGVFWFMVLAATVPAIVQVVRTSVHDLLKPANGTRDETNTVLAVCIDRGIRLVLYTAAGLWLAHVWQIDLVLLTDRDSLPTRAARALLTSAIILLIADFLWQLVKAFVDRELASAAGEPSADKDELVRRARMRTLLPIFRNTFLIVLSVLAILTVLATLGVEIAPLVAGAGVVGVALGFGAQTLVKDIIAGVFYLLDDAFRVGEYIQSGQYRGTVESFSLRSVKLRHHRGPVFTVPFGELGAVQNMSRDWVIDKFTISVTYDTDLEAMRKIVKKIGQELAADPELSPNIIEPMKMQGVQQFGEFAIDVRIKLTTKPNEQFVIRRKALAKLKAAFDKNGIKFAFPTVIVSGNDETGAAAARQAVELVQERRLAEKPGG